ncbi:MAG: alpha/beta hydrolase, partial [Planctomycetota bacterium]
MTLHPQAQSFVEEVRALDPPGWETMSPEQARRGFNNFAPLLGDAFPMDSVRDASSSPVPMRIYKYSE